MTHPARCSRLAIGVWCSLIITTPHHIQTAPEKGRRIAQDRRSGRRRRGLRLEVIRLTSTGRVGLPGKRGRFGNPDPHSETPGPATECGLLVDRDQRVLWGRCRGGAAPLPPDPPRFHFWILPLFGSDGLATLGAKVFAAPRLRHPECGYYLFSSVYTR